MENKDFEDKFDYIQEVKAIESLSIQEKELELIKKSLEKIINAENKLYPYSDEILVEKLADIGYELARRTIAKYRDQMGFPVARLRKKI